MKSKRIAGKKNRWEKSKIDWSLVRIQISVNAFPLGTCEKAKACEDRESYTCN